MQPVIQWLRRILGQPRATLVLIAGLMGLALVTSALAYAVNSPPANALAGGGSQTGQNADTVVVTLYDNHITSTMSHFVPGTHYHFTVLNQGTVDHEMMIMPRVMGPAMGSMPMGQLEHMALARTGSLAPGAGMSFEYSFPMAMTGHTLEFGCYIADHYVSGMHMGVTVGN